MPHVLRPELWLMVLIAGLPLLSETVYTPSLPDIAQAFQTPVAMAEYTLTIYLFGFALGVLFWGKLSDRWGRKPCIIAGLLVFIAGCISCYFSKSIEPFMMSRLLQAFGGSTGSVLGQALCRDAFHGPALGRAYSAIGAALALFPALGPLCGGLIAEVCGWRTIFPVLMALALIVMILVSVRLPETHPHASRKQSSIWNLATQLMQDKKVLGFGFIVAGCNGILFSYFAEGSFYLMKGLGLSPSHYGLSFIAIGAAAMLGGISSKRLHNHHSSKEIMGYGLWIIAFATTMFSTIALINHHLWTFSNPVLIAVTLIAQGVCIFGTSMASSNALALALKGYHHAIGTASSVFGFFYCCLMSIFTFVMGLLHDGTLLPMPLYFLVLSILMILVNGRVFKTS